MISAKRAYRAIKNGQVPDPEKIYESKKLQKECRKIYEARIQINCAIQTIRDMAENPQKFLEGPLTDENDQVQ